MTSRAPAAGWSAEGRLYAGPQHREASARALGVWAALALRPAGPICASARPAARCRGRGRAPPAPALAPSAPRRCRTTVTFTALEHSAGTC